ncbi:hypothetical protein KGY79_01295 [Candidatus Bipolaricaulota bacterium]|nr:hypothetical protein [Candidatus Bipolaricaulota bacterium]
MLPCKHLEVLQKLYSELKGTEVNWVVTGSVSFCLQGVPVSPNDLDIQTDKPGAYEIERLFQEYVIKKVKFSSTDRIKSHFGALKIEGVLVEIMGAVQKFYDGEWEEPIDIDKHKKIVTVKEMEIPVLNLGYESKAYRRFGRLEMAEKLSDYSDIQNPDNSVK